MNTVLMRTTATTGHRRKTDLVTNIVSLETFISLHHRQLQTKHRSILVLYTMSLTLSDHVTRHLPSTTVLGYSTIYDLIEHYVFIPFRQINCVSKKKFKNTTKQNYAKICSITFQNVCSFLHFSIIYL